MKMTDVTALVADAKPAVFWSDRADAPDVAPPLHGKQRADLAIIGSGFTGLWAALQAIQEQPGREITVLEAEVSGFGASNRNGGFCSDSLTHGLLNGLSHWPDEIGTILEMGRANLRDLLATLDREGIDAGVERTGQLSVATADWHDALLLAEHQVALEHGQDSVLLDTDAVRAEVRSPTYRSAVWDRTGTVMVDPALLAWGLRRTCESLGVRFHDHSRVTSTESAGVDLVVHTAAGSVAAPKVVVATNAWAEPVRQMRRYVVPLYDHVLMTEPLSAEQMDSIGWRNRQGLGDSGNQFHYYRLTADNRILWGGYDANYYRGNGLGPKYEEQTDSHVLIARHFFETFPQLEGLRFSHRWAGPIGTTSRFSAAFDTRYRGRLAWVAGFTGLGVGASRWGARVALDLVDGVDSERTRLAMVRKRPMPFPPEPLRNVVIQYTRKQIARADANRGREGRWLRLLDRFGIGFDS